ncbi:MAG: DUF4389 domain-containing protein [Proteobacteria bacterium]|nr:DUF4389 domain-containing protein [Pseudomonadota bacterium]
MAKTLKDHVSDPDAWIRLVPMFLYAAVLYLALLVIAAVVAVQFLLRLLTGSVNGRLSDFGGQLAAYAQQMVAFLTYHGEDKPYPFASWPAARKGRKKKSAA